MVHRSFLSVLLCVLVLSSIAVAQAPLDKTSRRARSKPKTTNSEEADAVAAQREVLAISLLQTLAEDARSFREPRLRARAQARVAARRIGGSDPDCACALTAVSTGLVPAVRVRAWETMDEAIKAANSAEGFTGEDSQVGGTFTNQNDGNGDQRSRRRF